MFPVVVGLVVGLDIDWEKRVSGADKYQYTFTDSD
jgi:hypothetical protein